jgi:FAD synthetase
LSEDLREKAQRYISAVEKALKKLEFTLPTKIGKDEVEAVVEAANRYLSDAKYFLANGKHAASLASISYAEGLLDAVKLLKLANFTWNSGEKRHGE